MSKLSLDKFLELVERSKLVEHDHLAEVVAAWKSQASPGELEEAQACAYHLVEIGVLTLWQCNKLQDGRYRGFFLGKYRLLDHLGSGGMSSVYLAEHVLMQRRVAIKVLPHNRVSDASYLARFHLEAQASAALDHRNIVRAYDLDNDGKIHYLVMEYIDGRDLHAVVCQDGPLDFHTAAHFIAQAATGLEHAHHCGLVHRDIKPANLLVDLKGTVKILDMGLAKFTVEGRPTPGFAQDEHVLGTADYLAPEQAVNSQTVDLRADIYSLGCTLYFLLTGHPPFADGTSLERMTAHQQQLAPSVLLDRPDAPPALVAICRRMMEKSVDNRYQTAGEVYQALHGWLENENAHGRVSGAGRLAAVHSSTGQRQLRELPKSKANLVSGSGLDLHGAPADPPRTASPLTDTDSNLYRATVKMPSHVLESRTDLLRPALPSDSQTHDSQSALQATGPPPVSAPSSGPLPPPIVNPPLAPPAQAWTSEPPPAASAPELLRAEAVFVDPQLAESRGFVLRRRRRRASKSSTWPWIALVSVTVFIALVWAIFGWLK